MTGVGIAYGNNTGASALGRDPAAEAPSVAVAAAGALTVPPEGRG